MTAYNALYDIMPWATWCTIAACQWQHWMLESTIMSFHALTAAHLRVVSDTVDSWAQISKYALKPFLNLHLHSQPALHVVYILYYTVRTQGFK